MKYTGLIAGLICIVSVTAISSQPLQAQPYPSYPIQLVIPGAPGDTVDISARSAAEELAKILKIAIIPVNKPGGGAVVATDFVAKGKKDGYTLLYAMSSGLIYSPAMSPDTVPYDPLRDVEPLGRHVTFPGVLSVQAESPWKNFTEVGPGRRVGPNAVNLREIPCPHRHPGESRGPEKAKKTGFRLPPE